MRSSKVYSIIETLLQEIVYPTSDPNLKKEKKKESVILITL